MTAWARTARGDLDGAVAMLETLSGNDDLYVAWWRTEGYLELADREDVDVERRHRLLESARVSAGGIDGWKRAEVLLEIASAFDAAGHREDAERCLQTAEELVQHAGAHQQRARVKSMQVRLWLIQGNMAAAARWADDYEAGKERAGSPPAYQQQLERTVWLTPTEPNRKNCEPGISSPF